VSYDDDDGHHIFVMRKDSIKIGRGGTGAWVDVQLMTGPKVSREHCWIRFDPSGRFFIQDVSTWGTSVNGERVPPPSRSDEGIVVEPGSERELPDGAAIGIAEVLLLHFHAGQR
jgi:pSer/pThr/pTyr-binding forkhead associated (FHA) protein